MKVTDTDVERVAAALAEGPTAAYTAPLVYPWSVRHLETQPMAVRPRPTTDPLRLYLHIPFCNYRCSFCFYAVRAGAKREEMERYVAAVERELEWLRPGTALAHLFVGGGTPTALPADLFARVLGAVFTRLTDQAKRSHTVEASPESVTAEHLQVLQDHGIGRVSMGIESMDETVLDTVRRRHSAEQARKACRMIVDRGLRLNIDLIYGLPGQTEDSFRRDLAAAVQAGVASMCLYALRLNRHTRVAAQLADEERFDLERLMRWRAFVTQTAQEFGLVQTHPYRFEQPRRPSGRKDPGGRGVAGDLFGLGVGARSQLGDTMYRNHERSAVYVERLEQGRSPVETLFRLDEDDRKTQFVMGNLGSGRPLNRTVYRNSFGVSIDRDFGDRMQRLGGGGLLRDDGEHVDLTDLGRLVYDRVLLCFYPERAVRWLRDGTSSQLGQEAPTGTVRA